MVKTSQLTKSHYKPKDIAEFLGVTTRTLQNWDKDGKINFRRDPVSDRRFLTKDDTITLLREHNLLYDDATDKRRDVIYARVSSHDQKSHGDLDRQIQFLIDQSDNLQNVVVLSEVGSELLGKEQVERLFLEHYLTLVGKDNQKVKLADHLNLDDIME